MMTTGKTTGNENRGLELDMYRRQVRLDMPYRFKSTGSLSDPEKTVIVTHLLDELIQKECLLQIEKLPEAYEDRRQLLRGLLNMRPPEPLKETFLNDLNRLLHDEAERRGIVDGMVLPPVSDAMPNHRLNNGERLVLWRGDITRLRVDAIVNAANDRLLGCFQPLHNCIDNVIHSAAGPLLRQDCNTIMEIQNQRERTGDAKITRAYHLPSRFVLHTVGPIIGDGPVSETQRNQLGSCYRSCLALADELGTIKTIAFPCISTGVFNFPRDLAADITIGIVDKWLSGTSHHFERVIFNVYLEEDLNEYIRVFQSRSRR